MRRTFKSFCSTNISGAHKYLPHVSTVLDFVCIAANQTDMAPVFGNFANTQRSVTKREETTGAQGESQGPYFRTGWGRKGYQEEDT